MGVNESCRNKRHGAVDYSLALVKVNDSLMPSGVARNRARSNPAQSQVRKRRGRHDALRMLIL
jgi:hypothetical protein